MDASNNSTTSSLENCTVNNFLHEFEYKIRFQCFRQRFLIENLNTADDPYEMLRKCVLKSIELGVLKAKQSGVERKRLIVSASIQKKLKCLARSSTARIHLYMDRPEDLVERFLELNICFKPEYIYYNPITIVLTEDKSDFLPEENEETMSKYDKALKRFNCACEICYDWD